MQTTRDWEAFQQWHELLDALCVEQGHHDNMALAEALCAASGNQTQAAFDAAVKNLQNWRQGIHIAQRRNFILLGKVLGIDHHEGLRERWNRLYREARPTRRAGPLPDAPRSEVSTRFPKRRRSAVAAGVILVCALGAATLSLPPDRPAETPDPGAASEAVVIEYVRTVSLGVGDSAIIHGVRSRGCEGAPTWESIRGRLPEPVTGVLTDGGVGMRHSRSCGEQVEVRAILFTATQAGTEQITLYGDAIEIQVSQ